MKRGILFAVLITFHILWIGTLTVADAAASSHINLPNSVMVSSVLLILWVVYQAFSWAHSSVQGKNK